MKVLQINSVCGIGSTGRIATDIHNILIKNGHESHIAYGREPSKNCDSTIKIGSKLDLYSHILETRIFDKHGFGSKQATYHLVDKIDEMKPDIIHLHNIHGYYLNIEVLFNYLRTSQIPVVWTLHDCWSFTGHCSHFDFVGCTRWEFGCYSCPQKKEYPRSILFDNSRKNYLFKSNMFNQIENMTIVTPSNWLAELVKRSYLNKYKIEVIGNGVDLSIFSNRSNSFREKYQLGNKFIILGVANIWGKRKGLEYFIKLAEDMQDDEAIVLVGLSSKQIKELPKQIIGISQTNNLLELVDIYSSADVFVNPTLEEVLGMTNLEALACGTPVITFETGGSPECIDENTGIVVGKRDINQLKAEILKVKNNLASFNKADLVNRVKKYYDKNLQYDKYVELYISILSNK